MSYRNLYRARESADVPYTSSGEASMKRWKPVSVVAATTVMLAAFGAGHAATTAPQHVYHASHKRTLSAAIVGPSAVKPYATCLWEAQVSGGTPPYTFAWISSTGDDGYTQAFYATAPGSHAFVIELYVMDAAGGRVELSTGIGVRSTAPTC